MQLEIGFARAAPHRKEEQYIVFFVIDLNVNEGLILGGSVAEASRRFLPAKGGKRIGPERKQDARDYIDYFRVDSSYKSSF